MDDRWTVTETDKLLVREMDLDQNRYLKLDYLLTCPDDDLLSIDEVRVTCNEFFSSLKPYNRSSSILKLCLITFKVNAQVVSLEEVPDGSLEKVLYWVSQQVARERTDLKFTDRDWNNIRVFHLVLKIVVHAYTIYPSTKSLDIIADRIMTDCRYDFDLLFQLLKTTVDNNESYAGRIIDFLLLYDHRTTDQAFQLLDFLAQYDRFGAAFKSLAARTCLSESKKIADFVVVHRILLQRELYGLAKSYAYRIIALKQLDNNEFDICEVQHNLVFINLQLGEFKLAADNYEQFVVRGNSDLHFPYRAELLIAFHRYATHHPIIEHLVAHDITEEEHKNVYAAMLIKIKRTEFRGDWEGALDIYKKADREFPEQRIITACFLSYNLLMTNNYAIIDVSVLKPLRESLDPYYELLAKRTELIVGLSENSIYTRKYQEELGKYFFKGIFEDKDNLATGNVDHRVTGSPVSPIFYNLYYPRILGEMPRLLEFDKYRDIFDDTSFINNIPIEEYTFWKQYAMVQRRCKNFFKEEGWNDPAVVNNLMVSFERMFTKAESIWHFRAVAVAFKEVAAKLPKNEYLDYFSRTISSFHKVLEHTVKSKLLAIISEKPGRYSNHTEHIRRIESLNLTNMTSTIDVFLRTKKNI
jgi:hypothetical protein